MPLIDHFLNFAVDGNVGTQQVIDGSRDAQVHHFKPSQNAPGLAFAGIPRPKFLFGARFIRNQPNTGSTNYFRPTNSDLSFMIKYVDRPKINFQTETLNEYNKKRVIHTQIQYQPITMRFYDSVDDRVLSFFQEYFAFYFGDGRKISGGEWAYDQIAANFNDAGSGWGFAPGQQDPGFSNYFSSLQLYQFYGGRYTLIELINPKISSFDHDSNDYEDGRVGTEITIQMEFEGIVYHEPGQRISGDVVNMFQLGRFAGLLDLNGAVKTGFDLPTPAQIPGIISRARSFTNVRSLANLLPINPNQIQREFQTFSQNPTTSSLNVLNGLQRGSGPSIFSNLNFGSGLAGIANSTSLSGLQDSFAGSVAGTVPQTSYQSSLTNFGRVDTGTAIAQIERDTAELAKTTPSLEAVKAMGNVTSKVAATPGVSPDGLILFNRDRVNLSNTALAGINQARSPSAQQGIAKPWVNPDASIQSALRADNRQP